MPEMIGWFAYIIFFDRVFILFVFTASVLTKIRNINAFTKTLSDFRLLRVDLIQPIARAFISLELFVVITALIGGRLLILTFVVAVFLLSLFTGALVRILLKGIKARCNCFGASSRDISIYDVVRNIIIVLVILPGALTQLSTKGQSAVPEFILGVILCLAAGSTALVMTKFDELLAVLWPASY